MRRKLRRGEGTEGLTWYAITGDDHSHNLDIVAEAFIDLMMKSAATNRIYDRPHAALLPSMIQATCGGFHSRFWKQGVKAATYLA
jgi:hypothetical protein